MRRIIFAALVTSLSTTAFAQSHDLPSPDVKTYQAMHPGHPVALEAGKTELQKEAERVEAYRRAYGLSQTTPVPYQGAPAPIAPPQRGTQTVRQPVAPNGIKNIPLYNTPASVSTHSVVKGDTLYNISKRYGVTIQDLQRVNRLRGTSIGLGQTLVIPVQKQAAIAPAPEAETLDPLTRRRPISREVEPFVFGTEEPEQQTAASDDVRLVVYAVASGDTLAAISRRTCVSENVLILENNLTNPDSLRPGHMLMLPEDHCLAR